MNDKVNCFVLSSSDYKDNDSLLQVLTKEYGLLSLVAKGSKKLSSKNRYMDLCLYEFIIDYKENKTIYTLRSGKLIKSYFDNIDLETMTFKNIIVEAILKSKEVINSNYYDELLFLFDNLNDNNKYLLGCLFMSFLLDEYGISPMVDECLVCGNKKVVGLSIKQGGFLCQKHTFAEDILDVDRLKKFRYVSKMNKIDYQKLIDNNLIYDKYDFMKYVDFFVLNSDIRLKSYEFYKKS